MGLTRQSPSGQFLDILNQVLVFWGSPITDGVTEFMNPQGGAPVALEDDGIQLAAGGMFCDLFAVIQRGGAPGANVTYRLRANGVQVVDGAGNDVEIVVDAGNGATQARQIIPRVALINPISVQVVGAAAGSPTTASAYVRVGATARAVPEIPIIM